MKNPHNLEDRLKSIRRTIEFAQCFCKKNNTTKAADHLDDAMKHLDYILEDY